MTQRLKLAIDSGGVTALRNVEAYVAKCGLEPALLELVRTRVSQINGCAFCLHMHAEDARKRGETDDRLLLLSAWHESALYTARERAALAWAEALTRVAETHAPDDVYAEAAREFDEKELVDLSIAIAMINAWNRLSVGFRAEHPSDRRKAA